MHETGMESHGTMGSMDMAQMMKDCLLACANCHDTCLQTLEYCLQKGGAHVEASHIKALIDCATLCHTCEDFMLRNSTMHASVCGVCAKACEACAVSCSDMNDDPQIQMCIDACNRCAETCNHMASMA